MGFSVGTMKGVQLTYVVYNFYKSRVRQNLWKALFCYSALVDLDSSSLDFSFADLSSAMNHITVIQSRKAITNRK